MTSQEWVRATNAVTALEQCGHALADALQKSIAALTMADAVLTRTRAWLADAEPTPERGLAEGQQALRDHAALRDRAKP